MNVGNILKVSIRPSSFKTGFGGPSQPPSAVVHRQPLQDDGAKFRRTLSMPVRPSSDVHALLQLADLDEEQQTVEGSGAWGLGGLGIFRFADTAGKRCSA